MTPQVLLLGSVLLVCLGLLLGATWTTQALHAEFHHRAEERRRLNEQWLAVRAAHRRQNNCPRCATRGSEQDWYLAPTPVEHPLDDD